MDVELLIEFMSGQDILWSFEEGGDLFAFIAQPFAVNPSEPIDNPFKWIDEDFKNKLIKHLLNISDEDLWESVRFVKHSHYDFVAMGFIFWGAIMDCERLTEKFDDLED